MTTGWSLSKSDITGDLSSPTKTMLSDLELGSPIPRQDSEPLTAMCVASHPGPHADDDELPEKAESVFGSLSQKSSSSSSNQSLLVEAQRILAEERFLEAEAVIDARRAKVEMARIAVLSAAHKSSSMNSQRSRSRFDVPVREMPLQNKKDVDISIPSLTGMGDTGERGISRDLSSLMKLDEEHNVGIPCDLTTVMQKCQVEEEEPMMEPEMQGVLLEPFVQQSAGNSCGDDAISARKQLEEAMMHEQERQQYLLQERAQFLLREDAQRRHEELLAHERQRMLAAEMHAQEREAYLISQAQLRLDSLRQEDREQVDALAQALHDEAIQNQTRALELERIERERHAAFQQVAELRLAAHHAANQAESQQAASLQSATRHAEHEIGKRVEAEAERMHTLLMNKERERAIALEEALRAERAAAEQREAILRQSEGAFEALRRQNEMLFAELKAAAQRDSAPRRPETYDISDRGQKTVPTRTLGPSGSDPAVPTFKFGTSTATMTMTSTSSSAPPAAARGNPERDPTPPRRPSPSHGGSGGGGGGGGDPGGSGGGGGPGKPPKPSTPRHSGDEPKLPKKKTGDDDGDDDDDDDSSSPSDPDIADEGDAVNKLLAKVLKSKKTRTKEADTIKLSTVPEAAVKFKTWWSETRNLVAAASGRGIVDSNGL